ncbi:ABC transporter substrate-binding protein [Chelatococcus reniformis]|uniref:Putative aliphatic sulfonates-binding protein n=1 Tax=Chelatococcus reniformis TaxID=1494448 RepID=A0A916U2U6_9HYPH|nr:ABC transporter substrate-binding protein [Chelatococcus reniformis]GGC57285.1 ABC transporter substrate-binding protein [Chelatococcus reniformis]
MNRFVSRRGMLDLGLAVLGGLGAAALPLAGAHALADKGLRVGNQKGGLRSLLEVSGQAADLPFALRWSEFQSAAPILEALNAGALDVGYTGDFSFLTVAAAGAPIRAIGGTRSGPATQAIVVPKDSPIRTVADLKGKTVAGTRGGWGHFLILAALKQAGVDADAVKIRYLAPPEALPAFTSGNIDAWAIWEPFVSQVVLRAGARVLVEGGGLTPSVTFLVATTEAIRERPTELAQFRARVDNGFAWVDDNRAAYAAYNSKLTGMPEDIVQRAFDNTRATPIVIDQALATEIQAAADLAASFGVLPRQIDVAGTLDTSLPAAG